MRVLILIVLLGLSSAQAFGSSCESLLLTPEQATAEFNREFKSAASGSPLLKRLVLRVKKSALRKELFKECTKGCTPEQLARGVRRLVEETGVPNALGYGFLVGGMVANAAFSTEILTLINPKLDFVPVFASSFLGQMSFVTLSLLAPFLEPISSKIRRSTFAMAKGADPIHQTHSLEEQADRINSTYTLREQHATDRILMLRNALRLNLETVSRAIATGDHDTVVAELGDAAMMGYRHFRDLSPEEPTIINAVEASFLRTIADRGALYEPVLAYIKARDPQFSDTPARFGELSAHEYYRRALDAWLRPR